MSNGSDARGSGAYGAGAYGAGTGHPRISRRLLLGGSAATLLLASSCSRVSNDATAVTVDSLLKERMFHIAHRGGAGDWPEMTAYAYDQAAKLPGLQAMDISVCRTADGVLVCSYDETTKRLMGTEYTILNETWATLSKLYVTPSGTNDPRQARRPFARLDDVIDEHIGQFVMVVEPRVKAALGDLMAKLISLDQPERIIWKQPIGSPRFADAKRHGFSTMGYVLDDPSHLGSNLVRFAASDDIDMIGTSRRHPDAFISSVSKAAARQHKKMITWDVTDARDRARVLRLGCSGIGSSDIKEMLGTPVTAKELAPVTG